MIDKKNQTFVRLEDSNLRFLKKNVKRDGASRSISILQERVPVRYEDGSEGKEWLDVRSIGEEHCQDESGRANVNHTVR